MRRFDYVSKSKKSAACGHIFVALRIEYCAIRIRGKSLLRPASAPLFSVQSSHE
jgi:hypothetical protein